MVGTVDGSGLDMTVLLGFFAMTTNWQERIENYSHFGVIATNGSMPELSTDIVLTVKRMSMLSLRCVWVSNYKIKIYFVYIETGVVYLLVN